MSPIEHFIIAVIPVGTAILLFTRRRPSASVIGAAFVGSQFPDLIDKPLAFYSGAIPTGRVFMHSLPVAIPFLLAVGVYGWRTNTNMLSLAFVFGHLSHIIGDTYQTLLSPNPALSPDLLWPFVDPIARPEIPHWAGPNSINVHLWTVFSLAVLGYTTWWVSTASEQD